MNRYEISKSRTRYLVECVFCGRRFDIPANKGPIVPFHLQPKGPRCLGSVDQGRIVETFS